jgi:3-phenylpropionate/trans-cinnamate dioxygenase ferredoxin reductase subunit
MLQNVVIVGAGQAAAQAIDTLRRRGFDGSIVLVGDEEHEPYQRPPLSKHYLAGGLDHDRLRVRPPQFYSDRRVELQLGTRATAIDRHGCQVRLRGGAVLGYDALLLAVGSRPRPLAVSGADLGGIHYLRTLGDAERLRAELRPGRRLVVVGGGYLGLEVAATARVLGLEVTVLELTPRVMSRGVSPEVSTFFEAEHARRGVRVVKGVRVTGFAETPGTGQVCSVLCADGTEYAADVVLIGIGVAPEQELAAEAGLACADGIVVDRYCRTADARIYAAGDCTRHPASHYGLDMRLESVDNAFEQGTSAALNLLGIETAHEKIPWFWSDQFDLKLVIVGLSQGHDSTVLRGDPASRSFSVCYLRRTELVAIDTVNSPKDQIAARKLIAARARVDPARLRDAALALKDCAVA